MKQSCSARHKSPGSILLFTLLLMSIITILTQQLVRAVFVGSVFDRSMVQREQVEMLALSGVNIAIAQLTLHEVEKDQKAVSKPTSDDQKAQQPTDESSRSFLKNVLPFMNHWQKFELSKDREGCEGTIKVCICCEEGKVNLNKAFDFAKGEFVKPFDKLIATLKIEGGKQQLEFGKTVGDFLKKRKKPLDDISQLLNARQLAGVDLFYSPIEAQITPEALKKRGEEFKNRSIALADLFTVATDSNTINPLFFSDAVCKVLGLRRPQPTTGDEKKDDGLTGFTKTFNASWASDWSAHLNELQPLYGPLPPQMPDIKEILAREIEPRIYSVVSFGIANGVEQKLIAIIERVELPYKSDSTSQSSNNQEQKKSTMVSYKINKIYLI